MTPTASPETHQHAPHGRPYIPPINWAVTYHEGEKRMYTFHFSCRDNGGKFQAFTVKAKDKTEAIRKGFKKADKNAKGDIISWDCRLQLVF